AAHVAISIEPREDARHEDSFTDPMRFLLVLSSIFIAVRRGTETDGFTKFAPRNAVTTATYAQASDSALFAATAAAGTVSHQYGLAGRPRGGGSHARAGQRRHRTDRVHTGPAPRHRSLRAAGD